MRAVWVVGGRIVLFWEAKSGVFFLGGNSGSMWPHLWVCTLSSLTNIMIRT